MSNGRGRHTWARERPFGAIHSIFRLLSFSLSPSDSDFLFSYIFFSMSLRFFLSLSLCLLFCLYFLLFLPFIVCPQVNLVSSTLHADQTPRNKCEGLSPMSLSTNIPPRANRPRRLVPIRRIARGLFLDCYLFDGNKIVSRRRWRGKKRRDEYWNRDISKDCSSFVKTYASVQLPTSFFRSLT